MGTGRMAHALLQAIRDEGGEVTAVSSASQARADRFASDHGIPRAHGDHHALVEDPDVDVIYVATTNDRHHGDALACIAAGRPVLLEKPFTLNLPQAREVADAARTDEVFVMEAMWMRFQPAFLEVERRIADGQIGRPQLVQADLGFRAEADPTGRLFTAGLGGGSLLDVGVYPLTLAISFLGVPTAATAVAQLNDDGVDTQVSAAMQHDHGTSTWSCSLATDSAMEATIGGPEGSLRFEAPFHLGARITRRRHGAVIEEFAVPEAELMYRFEVREVHRCLDRGATESARMPLDLSQTVMRCMDDLRRQIGVTYPHE